MTNHIQKSEDNESPFRSRWAQMGTEARERMHSQALTARANLEKFPARFSPSTTETYQKALSRFVGEKSATIQSRSRLRIFRAALISSLKKAVLDAPVSDPEKLCSAVYDLFTFVRCVENTAESLDGQQCGDQAFLRLGKWLADNGIQVLGPERTNFSARVGRVHRIKRYPKDWRERMLNAIQTGIPNMKEAVVVLAVTGCRPSELTTAELSLHEDGVQITVESLKSLGGKDPTRRGAIYEANEITSTLISLAQKGGRPFSDIKYKALDNLLQRTSQKRGVFPESLKVSIRSSDFRNQLVADSKAGGRPPEEIAMLLGHISTLQQKAYGRSALGRRSSLFFPAKVLQSHEVRHMPLAFPRSGSPTDTDGANQNLGDRPK
jgi:integrase